MWRLPIFSISWWRARPYSTPWRYFCVAPLETFVLSLWGMNLLILKGAIPRTVSYCISITNIWWSPTPKPAGMTQACVIVMSVIAHTPSMGLDPWNKVAPICFPVKSPTTSDKWSPSLLVSALPMDFFYTSLLVLRHTISLSPLFLHSSSCLTRSSQKSLLGQERSFLLVIKYLRCC
jgi:hypothetical protein